MDYKTLTDEKLQTERQNIMDEIARRNDLADIPKQAKALAFDCIQAIEMQQQNLRALQVRIVELAEKTKEK